MFAGYSKSLKIILTACGCPGASTLIRMLKHNGERPIEIIGTDMDPEAVGRFLCDGFYKVPPGTSSDYIERMADIGEKEKPDILFHEPSNEVLPLARDRDVFESLGTKVIVSDPEAIENCVNKHLMYETLSKRANIELPDYGSASTLDEFVETICKLGYPEKPVVFKPHVGKGSRGVRIIDPDIDRKKQLLKEKPTSKFMSLEEFSESSRKPTTRSSLTSWSWSILKARRRQLIRSRSMVESF